MHKRLIVAGLARHFAIQASGDAQDALLNQTMGYLLDALQDYSRHVRGVALPAPPKPSPIRRKLSRWQLFKAFLRGEPPRAVSRQSNGRFGHG